MLHMRNHEQQVGLQDLRATSLIEPGVMVLMVYATSWLHEDAGPSHCHSYRTGA